MLKFHRRGSLWKPDCVRDKVLSVPRQADQNLLDFDEQQISYSDLLNVFFATHDPTTLNQQDNDIGTQYRSVIFYIEEYQKSIIKNSLHKLNNSTQYNNPIVTEIRLLDIFYLSYRLGYHI